MTDLLQMSEILARALAFSDLEQVAIILIIHLSLFLSLLLSSFLLFYQKKLSQFSDLEQVAIILIIHFSSLFFLSSFLLFYQKGRC